MAVIITAASPRDALAIASKALEAPSVNLDDTPCAALREEKADNEETYGTWTLDTGNLHSTLDVVVVADCDGLEGALERDLAGRCQ